AGVEALADLGEHRTQHLGIAGHGVRDGELSQQPVEEVDLRARARRVVQGVAEAGEVVQAAVAGDLELANQDRRVAGGDSNDRRRGATLLVHRGYLRG